MPSNTISFQLGTLQDLIDSLNSAGQSMDGTVAMRVMAGVCAGVKCFHTAEPAPLAHRDIKVCLVRVMGGHYGLMTPTASQRTARA